MKPNLNKITQDFGRTYRQVEELSNRKNKRQIKMFNAFTEAIKNQTLSQQIVEHLDLEYSAQEYVNTYYPGWILKSQDGTKLLVEQDPTIIKFPYVNHEDGYVYGRTFSQSGPSLNDEKIREEDPDLWEQITQWPEPLYSIANDVAQFFAGHNDIDHGIQVIFETHQIERVLKSPSEWTDDQKERMAKYWLPGRLAVRLVPPRRATPEELGEA